MNSAFAPSHFFKLTDYIHRELFREDQPVWTALDRLQSYFGSLGPVEQLGDVSADAYVINPETVHIQHGVVIEPGAYVKGPCFLGAGTVVRHGAYVRGGVITGRSCVIGHSTEVKNSILLDKAQAAHFAYLGDSVLGNKVNLGAGTRCANLRLDNQEVRLEGQYPSGRRKLGAIIGDGAQLGCNCVTNPGTLIEPGGLVLPCTSVKGRVEAAK